MSLDAINSDKPVGTPEWHKDIAKQLCELAGTEEEKQHYKDLAAFHVGISKRPLYEYAKTK